METDDKLCPIGLTNGCGYWFKLQTEIKQLKAENGSLKKFARHVINTECWALAGEQDGAELQDLAEKLGLIKSNFATKEDAENNEGFEIGEKIYKFTDILKGD